MHKYTILGKCLKDINVFEWSSETKARLTEPFDSFVPGYKGNETDILQNITLVLYLGDIANRKSSNGSKKPNTGPHWLSNKY